LLVFVELVRKGGLKYPKTGAYFEKGG